MTVPVFYIELSHSCISPMTGDIFIVPQILSESEGC